MMYREDAIEIDFYGGTLDKCVEHLIECREYGENVYIVFNGHELYSCDVTMDSAYMEVMGKTKEQYDEDAAAWLENYEREYAESEAAAEDRIPEWVERGHAIIRPDQMEEWEECVDARAHDLYHGSDLECALQLMEMLYDGEYIDDVVNTFNEQGHSGASAGMVRAIINTFSERGDEFVNATAY